MKIEINEKTPSSEILFSSDPDFAEIQQQLKAQGYRFTAEIAGTIVNKGGKCEVSYLTKVIKNGRTITYRELKIAIDELFKFNPAFANEYQKLKFVIKKKEYYTF